MIELKTDTIFMWRTGNNNENTLDASYRVSYQVARARFTAKPLIGLCVKDIVQCLFRENAAKKVDVVLLQNDMSRINDTSSNTETSHTAI
jgi:hypothetical protein